MILEEKITKHQCKNNKIADFVLHIGLFRLYEPVNVGVSQQAAELKPNSVSGGRRQSVHSVHQLAQRSPVI